MAKVLWSLGDYSKVADRVQSAARELVEACKVRPGIEVLDVAAGNGNVAIAAAWRGASVVASDLTPHMVELGKERSASEGVDIEWQEADVEALPFEKDRFDVVTSAFGAMFAPRPEVAASEIFRVARSRGTVGLVNWTAAGFIGRLAEVVDEYAPPRPPGVSSPMTWGDPDVVGQRFSGLAGAIDARCKLNRFTFASRDEMTAFFGENLGPLIALKNVLPQEKFEEMMARIKELIGEFDQGKEEVVIDSEYLLVIAQKADD